MMKKFLACCFMALSMLLSGCAGEQREAQKPVPQISAQQEARAAESPTQPDKLEEQADVYSDQYTGTWRDMEDPQYGMIISSADGSSYTIEVTWSGSSQSSTVWQLTGTYDDIWEGIAYVGAKYEEIEGERLPVPDREEITGLFYIGENGALLWIDDFDHAGDRLHFVKE